MSSALVARIRSFGGLAELGDYGDSSGRIGAQGSFRGHKRPKIAHRGTQGRCTERIPNHPASVDLAHDIFNRVFRKVPDRVNGE